MTNKKVISYLLFAGLCIELFSPFATVIVSATSPTTSIDTITPYQVTSSPLVITATNIGPVDNITLFYRYSANNYSDWCPGKDYAILTAGDYVTKTDDTDINYPQRMWYDEENQLLYVVNSEADNLQIWNVADSDNLVKLYTLKDSTYHNFAHDVSVKSNWSYGGTDYGNIAFTAGMGTTKFYFNTINCNLSTQPAYLDNFEISDDEGYTKLGYVQVMQRGDCLYAAVTRLSGKINIFNVTDPEDIVNMSYVKGTDIVANQTDWWWPTWSPDGMHLYVSGAGANHSLVIFDTSDLTDPTYAGYVGPNIDWITLPYYDRTNLSRVYAGVRVGAGGNGDDYLKVFDVSDPESWSIIETGPDLKGTCEWQEDFYTNDWGASRKYDGASNNTGINVWNFRNINDIYFAGYFSAAYTTHSHMQWLDYNNSRIFALAYGLGGGNTIYIVKWQISLAQESSWYEYDVDTAAPWSWDFDFPNGAGYYEFCSVGRKAGESDEAFPVSANACCFFELNNPPYVPSNPHPVNNSEDISLDASLSWIGGDPNIDDIITYDVYFGTSNPPLKVSSNQSVAIYNPGALEFSTTYYWKIVAWDNHGLSTDGSTWQFTTRNESNRPPYTPSDPFPADKAIYVNMNTNLSWIGGDPDPADTVTYDIYFGTTNPPPKLVSNQSISTYQPESMHENTTYYWKIIAWDSKHVSTSGPIWSYTTINTEQFIPSFILGRITNKSLYDEVIMFDVVKALKITFSPIHSSIYAPYEEITIDKVYIGLIRTHFIFALCTVSPT